MKIGAQTTILPVGSGGKSRELFLSTALLHQKEALTFFRLLCHSAAGLWTKAFLSPVQGAQAQAALPALCCPQWLRKPLSSAIYTTPDASRETLTLFWKETILLWVPIFRLYKAHLDFCCHFLYPLSLLFGRQLGSFVFKRSAPTGSSLWALECSGVCLPSFWPKPQVMTFTPEELN